ncbi:hypothetical protein [Aquamicrobium terrae]
MSDAPNDSPDDRGQARRIGLIALGLFVLTLILFAATIYVLIYGADAIPDSIVLDRLSRAI